MRSSWMSASIAILFLVLFLGFFHFSNKPVQRIIVQGNLSLTESILLNDRLKKGSQARILDFELFKLVNKIKDEFQWIHSIGIDRDWPSTLILNIEKIVPIAKWNDGQYISSQGQVIKLENDRKDLPRFKVVLSSPLKSMEIYRDLTSRLKPWNLSISEISENSLGEWSLKLSNGLSIELGRNHLDKRLNSSMVVYNSFDGVFEARSSFIDARYMGGVAFRRSDLGDSGSNFWFSNID